MKNKTTSVALLVITHNRIQYTQKAIEALRQCNLTIPFDLFVVDNASNDGTREYLEEEVSFSNGKVSLHFNSSNQGLSEVTNWFWSKVIDSYDFCGKVDNDTLVPITWLSRLIKMHQIGYDKLGVISGFPFRIDIDWNFESGKHNLKNLEGAQLLVQPQVGGCSYIIRSSLIKAIGPLEENITMKLRRGKRVRGLIHGWKEWQQRARGRGFVHGYPYPFEVVEHMDDPASQFCLLDKDESVTALAKKNSEQRGGIYSRDRINRQYRRDARYLLTEYRFNQDI